MAKRIKNILIAGDSFAAPYPNTNKGWSTLLASNYNVTNVAQAGISEYKIYKQISSASIDNYDLVIICHTSPYRVHTLKHPVHKTELHSNCDLILADIDSHTDWFNPSLKAAKGWFRYHNDDVYLEDTYRLYRKEIKNLTNAVPCLNIDNLKASLPFANEDWHLDLTNFWLSNKGNINHYTADGNKQLCNMLTKKINDYEKIHSNS